MQESPKWIGPPVVHDEVVEPGEVSDIFTLLSGSDVLRSVTILADKPIAFLLAVDHLSSSISDETLESLVQLIIYTEIPGQRDSLVLKDSELFAGTLLIMSGHGWSIRPRRCSSLQVLARGNSNGIVGIGV